MRQRGIEALKRSRLLRRCALVLAAAATLQTAAPLLAGTDTYVGPPGGDWNTSSFWSPAGVPQPGDTVLFQPFGNGSYLFDGQITSGSLTDAQFGTLTLSSPLIIQNGSQTELQSLSLEINSGTFDQSAGLNNVTGTISIADGGNATYDLSQSAQLNGGTVFLGRQGAGTFCQSGGSLILEGFNVGAEGTGYYSISSGNASVASVEVGGDANSPTSSGVIDENGANANLDINSSLTVGNFGAGTLVLDSGSLNTEIAFFGSSNGGTGTYVQDGSLSVCSLGTLEFGGAGGYGTFSNGTLSLQHNLYVGDFALHGTSTACFTQSGGFATLNALGVGYYNYCNGTFAMTGGSLTANAIFTDGGNASILFSGGSIQTNVLTVAQMEGGHGTFVMSGGTLNAAYTTEIGGGAVGYFSQTGGTASFGSLIVGGLSQDSQFPGTGTYLLSGGALEVNTLTVGQTNSVGTFAMTGGSLQVNQILIGETNSSGTFIQGQNFASTGISSNLFLGNNTSTSSANAGTGTYIQTAGADNFYNIFLGDGTDSSGTYILNPSQSGLPASITTGFFNRFGEDGLFIGYYGNGTFIQNAGTVTINEGGSFYLASLPGSNGTYVLNAGVLNSESCYLGNQGAASLLVSGSGVASIEFMSVGLYAGASGYVNVNSGGLLNAESMAIGGTNGGMGTLIVGPQGSTNIFGTMTITLGSSLQISGGSLLIDKIYSAGSLTITGGTLAITGAGSLGSGSIASSGLSISGPGVLDVGTTRVVIEYGSGPSPVGDLSFAQTARNYPANSIQRYAQTAINGLNWNGPGINSSYAANDPNGLTAVGIADENDLLNVYPSNFTVAGGGPGTWMGQPITDTNNVLVRMTWYGDGNLDGVVNRLDVTALSQGYNGIAGYVGWSDGDYTYSGDITKVDVGLLAQSYLFQGAPLGDAITAGQAQYLLALDPEMPANVQADFQSIAGTPEPASLSLMAASLGLLARRRRTRTIAPWCGSSPTP